jgi:hypothetical protein
MAHLTAEQLIDVAEGAEPQSSASHLQVCHSCREQLAALRTTMSVVTEIEVPEPSPLFWDHLSARVHDAVEADAASTSSMPGGRRSVTGAAGGESVPSGRWSWLGTGPVWLTALGVLVAAVSLVIRLNQPSTVPAPPPSVAVIPETSNDLTPVADDPSLSLVADLAVDLDWESAREAGFTTHIGADDDAVNQLTDGERRELRLLLQGELSRSRRGA